jgi:hypothetical protein
MQGLDIYMSTLIKSALLCGCYYLETVTLEDENMWHIQFISSCKMCLKHL